MSLLIKLLLGIDVLISLLIILIVLMQRPKNEGLGAAFGGGMTENLFGAQTTNVLASITRWLGGIFFAVSLLLSFLYARYQSPESATQMQLKNSPVPPPAAATPAPAALVPAPATPAPEGAVPAAPGPATPEVAPSVETAPVAPATPESTVPTVPSAPLEATPPPTTAPEPAPGAPVPAPSAPVP